MNAAKAEVRLTANFERNLDTIEQFLVDAGAAQAFDVLLNDLLDKVIPNLEEFPAMGAPFLARQGGSVEVKRALETLKTKLSPGADVRTWLWGEYLVLYCRDGSVVSLLAIKHHRQLTFDLHSVWK